jgi:hypothetical protein
LKDADDGRNDEALPISLMIRISVNAVFLTGEVFETLEPLSHSETHQGKAWMIPSPMERRLLLNWASSDHGFCGQETLKSWLGPSLVTRVSTHRI